MSKIVKIPRSRSLNVEEQHVYGDEGNAEFAKSMADIPWSVNIRLKFE